MKMALLLSTVIFCAGCHHVERKNLSSAAELRDGSSFERAIQINAKNHDDGLDAEHEWLRRNLPGARLAEGGTNSAGEESVVFPHRTEAHGNALFSIYTMQLPDGRYVDVFFDQTHYLNMK
jgi:hypothetical protein